MNIPISKCDIPNELIWYTSTNGLYITSLGYKVLFKQSSNYNNTSFTPSCINLFGSIQKKTYVYTSIKIFSILI